MSIDINPKVAAWMARVIEAIGQEGSLDAGYGEYHLGAIPIMFDNDPNTGLAIGWNEHGELTILATDPTTPTTSPEQDESTEAQA